MAGRSEQLQSGKAGRLVVARRFNGGKGRGKRKSSQGTAEVRAHSRQKLRSTRQGRTDENGNALANHLAALDENQYNAAALIAATSILREHSQRLMKATEELRRTIFQHPECRFIGRIPVRRKRKPSGCVRSLGAIGPIEEVVLTER